MSTPTPSLDRNTAILGKYLPAAAVDLIAAQINQLNFKLKIKRERATKLGDYRSPHSGMGHVITINRNLNKYAFLITLVHEMAHLTNWNLNKNRVKPHGAEWKAEFKKLMQPFMNVDCFPAEVLSIIAAYAANPAASSCGDPDLLRALKKYDPDKGLVLVEDLPHNARFRTATHQLFIKQEKRRTRYLCLEVNTNKKYLFNGLAEVYLAT